jgi:hypothetical protein
VTLEATRRVAVTGMPGLSPRRAVAGASVVAAGPRGPLGRSPDADGPAALADLDLAQARRRQLRDQRRDQLVGEAVDGGVVRQAGVGGTLVVRGLFASDTTLGR